MRDILCPMPSTVTRVNVKNGDRVKKGDVLLVVEDGGRDMERGRDVALHRGSPRRSCGDGGDCGEAVL